MEYVLFVENGEKWGMISSVILNTKGGAFQLETDREKAIRFSEYETVYAFKEFIESAFDLKCSIMKG